MRTDSLIIERYKLDWFSLHPEQIAIMCEVSLNILCPFAVRKRGLRVVILYKVCNFFKSVDETPACGH